MRVLIAEDNPVLQLLLERLITKWGHESVICKDGAKAWEVFQEGEPPLLLILDWMMPGMDGVDLCKKIRALPDGDQFYVIMLTSKGETEDMVQGLQSGANDYVTKPFAHAELEARLQVGVRMIELREALIASEQKRTLMAAAGAAAHEINQPLTVILGMVDLWMAQMPDDEAVRERLNPIQTAAERIRDIVKQMLKIEQFTTKPYVGDSVIVDFEASSSESSEADRDV